MPETRIIEKVRCYFCHKRDYVDPNKSGEAQGWYLDLFQKALALEENWYSKRPESREKAGLLQGRSLKRLKDGQYIYLPFEDGAKSARF